MMNLYCSFYNATDNSDTCRTPHSFFLLLKRGKMTHYSSADTRAFSLYNSRTARSSDLDKFISWPVCHKTPPSCVYVHRLAGGNERETGREVLKRCCDKLKAARPKHRIPLEGQPLPVVNSLFYC